MRSVRDSSGLFGRVAPRTTRRRSLSRVVVRSRAHPSCRRQPNPTLVFSPSPSNSSLRSLRMPSTRFLIAALLSSLSLLPSTTSTPNQSPGKRFSYAEYLEGKQIPLGPSLAGGEAARVLDAAAEGVVPPVVLDSTGNGPASGELSFYRS